MDLRTRIALACFAVAAGLLAVAAGLTAGAALGVLYGAASALTIVGIFVGTIGYWLATTDGAVEIVPDQEGEDDQPWAELPKDEDQDQDEDELAARRSAEG